MILLSLPSELLALLCEPLCSALLSLLNEDKNNIHLKRLLPVPDNLRNPNIPL
jgi:hypothetical protein